MFWKIKLRKIAQLCKEFAGKVPSWQIKIADAFEREVKETGKDLSPPSTLVLDLFAIMLVLVELALLLNKRGADDAIKIIYPLYRSTLNHPIIRNPNWTVDEDAARVHLLDRTDFYAEKIGNKELRGELFQGSVPQWLTELNNLPGKKLAVVFAECVANPGCMEDYDFAPFSSHDMTTLMIIAQTIMFPLGTQLSDFFWAVYDCAEQK